MAKQKENKACENEEILQDEHEEVTAEEETESVDKTQELNEKIKFFALKSYPI